MNIHIGRMYGCTIDLKKMNDNPTIVDAGACTGGFIKRWGMHRKDMEYKIIAIECDRDNIETLKKRKFRNITICEKALVGRKLKQKPIYYQYLGCPNSGSVGYEKAYVVRSKACKGVLKYKVDTLAINDIFSEFGIDEIDYIKMNVEGAERDIFKAMTQKTASKINQMSVSVHIGTLPGLTCSAILQRLHELGFKARLVRRKQIYGYYNGGNA